MSVDKFPIRPTWWAKTRRLGHHTWRKNTTWESPEVGLSPKTWI
jgi:hypothetical protein